MSDTGGNVLSNSAPSGAVPSQAAATSSAPTHSVLSSRGLCKSYGKGDGLVRAVDEVSLDVATARRSR